MFGIENFGMIRYKSFNKIKSKWQFLKLAFKEKLVLSLLTKLNKIRTDISELVQKSSQLDLANKEIANLRKQLGDAQNKASRESTLIHTGDDYQKALISQMEFWGFKINHSHGYPCIYHPSFNPLTLKQRDCDGGCPYKN